MAHWIFKTEPSEYSYADLVRDKRCVWEGVANATALIHLRTVSKGDPVLVYHTGSEKACVALAEVVRGPYPDPKLDDPRRVVVDLKPVRALAHPVPLATFRTDALLKDTDLVRIARLSVIPLSAAQFARVQKLAGERA
jgi:predicted RNA-binding protein with PUA-like domain